MQINSLSKYSLMFDSQLPGVDFIIRTQPPIIVGQVVQGEDLVSKLITEGETSIYARPYAESEWAVFLIGKLDNEPMTGTAQEQADQLAKIMRKMSDFYLHNKK